jgi:signal transduction histidine kinase/CheY-like chemotaxis protein
VLCVEIATGPPGQAVDRARQVHGGVPLGYVARDETDALQAIAHGADEALVLPVLDQQHILGLLERTTLRARLRREQENFQTSHAQSEKLAALGTVVAGVAHEINNPLAAVLLSVDAARSIMSHLVTALDEIERLGDLERDITTAEMANLTRIARVGAPSMDGNALLDEMSSAVQSIADVVRDLRIFARTEDEEQPQIVHVPEVIDQVVRIVGREISSRGVIERDYADDLPKLVVPRTRLVQVITNILINAAHAIREVERQVHRVRVSIRADDEYVAISISDTGPGIPPESIERIFDPFFTTKRESVGTGLGLSISRSILQKLDGDLIVESVHGVGATFIALIPLPDKQAIRDAYLYSSPSISITAITERATIMVVDDDERVLRAYSRVLRNGYDVILASDGQEAIDLLSSGSRPDVLISDLLLPEVDGVELFQWLESQRPTLARATIFVSAATTVPHYAEFCQKLSNPILEKPVSKERLLSAIEQARQSNAP